MYVSNKEMKKINQVHTTGSFLNQRTYNLPYNVHEHTRLHVKAKEIIQMTIPLEEYSPNGWADIPCVNKSNNVVK